MWRCSTIARLVDGFFLSLKVAVITGTLSVILGTFAFVLVRYLRFTGRSLFSGLVSAPMVMPGNYRLVFAAADGRRATRDRLAGTRSDDGVLGHTLLGMAYATVVISARLREMDRRIEEAAMDLGCKPSQVLFLVTLPNILPSLIAAWMLTFTLSFDDIGDFRVPVRPGRHDFCRR